MKTSLSSFVFFRYSMTDAIYRTAQYGYDAIEIWGGRPHAYWEDMRGQRLIDIKTAIKNSGIAISNFIPAQFRYPTNLAAPEPEIRNGSIDYIKKSIDSAAEIGAPFVSLCPGFSLFGQNLSDAWKAMINSFQQLLDHAKDMPLKLLIEPGNRYETDLIVTVEDGLKAISELEGEMGILPDTGHLFINQEALSDVVKKVEGYIQHFHIDDNMGVTDDHMIPGTGKMQYDVFLSKLHASGYKGYLAVELGFGYTVDPDPAVKASIDFLHNKFKQLDIA